MVIIEINEFSPTLMANAADELNAANLKRLLTLTHSKTVAHEKLERFGLDPWVQWVGIHTGVTAREHGVAHLGDVPQLRHPQIWETLSARGLRFGVWGAMNASCQSQQNCDFFFPDPWTFSEQAYPRELNEFLAFPRYYSKNYQDISKTKAFFALLQMARFCLRPRIAAALLPLAPTLITHVVKYGTPEYLLFLLFDLVNTQLFATYYARKKPDFAVLFLNSIAHLQHHKWTEPQGVSPEMRVGFTLFDKILGILFDAIPNRIPIVAANAFSQQCSYDENEYLYRQKNPENFLRVIGLKFSKVEQAMTNDGHVFFESEILRDQAIAVLKGARIDGKPIFHVDQNTAEPLRIFYQFILWDELPPNTTLTANHQSFRFYDLFDMITRRSGTHLIHGDVFARGVTIPNSIYNNELAGCILEHFTTKGPAASQLGEMNLI